MPFGVQSLIPLRLWSNHRPDWHVSNAFRRSVPYSHNSNNNVEENKVASPMPFGVQSLIPKLKKLVTMKTCFIVSNAFRRSVPYSRCRFGSN